MSQTPHNNRHVITRSDISPGYRAASIDNSIYARFSEGVAKLKRHPSSTDLRRILSLLGSKSLQAKVHTEFLISQALYYDRIKDVPDAHWAKEDADEALVRFAEPILIEKHAPGSLNNIREWPVARVDSVLKQFEKPSQITQETQDGQTVERRMTPMSRRTDLGTKEMRDLFVHDYMLIEVAICVYEPDGTEDRAATAFGFPDFASVDPRMVADVCHVASHLRFSRTGDVLVALDQHFLKRKKELNTIGVVCLDPAEFMGVVDPKGEIQPAEVT